MSILKAESRQVMRRRIFQAAMVAVNRKNLREVGESHYIGMSRSERRSLARAYAAKAFDAARVERAKQAVA